MLYLFEYHDSREIQEELNYLDWIEINALSRYLQHKIFDIIAGNFCIVDIEINVLDLLLICKIFDIIAGNFCIVDIEINVLDLLLICRSIKSYMISPLVGI